MHNSHQHPIRDTEDKTVVGRKIGSRDGRTKIDCLCEQVYRGNYSSMIKRHEPPNHGTKPKPRISNGRLVSNRKKDSSRQSSSFSLSDLTCWRICLTLIRLLSTTSAELTSMLSAKVVLPPDLVLPCPCSVRCQLVHPALNPARADRSFCSASQSHTSRVLDLLSS